ncbi:MAG TPA: barstar family protein [Fimbriimonadaceae bacterium]|nr:barstar family protein [Fimbriimonadaceae bacterium]
MSTIGAFFVGLLAPDAPGAITAELDRQDLHDLRELAEKAGFDVRTVAVPLEGSRESLFETLAKVYEFPSYFGYNWDALTDCWSDLPAAKTLCLLRHPDRLEPEDRATLIEVAGDVAERCGSEPERIFRLVLVA